MPIITPVKLKIRFTGASVRPTEMSRRLTAPFRPKRIIHAKVRTRKLVQNGISTRSVRVSRAVRDTGMVWYGQSVAEVVPEGDAELGARLGEARCLIRQPFD
jgi:hypothetical protein